jgi:hypothetical protein
MDLECEGKLLNALFSVQMAPTTPCIAYLPTEVHLRKTIFMYEIPTPKVHNDTYQVCCPL